MHWPRYKSTISTPRRFDFGRSPNFGETMLITKSALKNTSKNSLCNLRHQHENCVNNAKRYFTCDVLVFGFFLKTFTSLTLTALQLFSEKHFYHSFDWRWVSSLIKFPGCYPIYKKVKWPILRFVKHCISFLFIKKKCIKSPVWIFLLRDNSPENHERGEFNSQRQRGFFKRLLTVMGFLLKYWNHTWLN